ncbi:glycosyltransferase family 4 protein [Algiphilus sp.]|uniref:glycosyltransferase family 4 protein n=1 Tax=Algiphilus sp. TaxID=1872431 RepID=UPI003B51D1D4
MRILSVTTSYPLTRDSASGIFVARLLRELARQHEVTVVTPAATLPAEVLGPEHVVTVRYAPMSLQVLAHKPGGIPVQLRQSPAAWLLVPLLLGGLVWKLLQQGRRADVLHANWAIAALPAAFAGRLWGLPVVTTLRGDDVTGAAQRRISRWIMAMALKVSKKVVVVSASMQEQLTATFPDVRNKLVFIPNGVAVTRQTESSRLHGRRLLAVGSLIERKQIDVILRALVQLPEGYTLTVVGEGPEEVALLRLADRLGVTARITWTGSRAPESMGELYAGHDLLVHAARSEGRPNVVVEALAAGVPVAGSDIPGVREILEHSAGGVLFPVGNEKELAASIRDLLESPEKWKACSAAGPRWVERERLSWSGCAQRYTALFEMVRAH